MKEKNKKLEEEKNTEWTDAKELELAKLAYTALSMKIDNFKKSFIYLEWLIDNRIKELDNALDNKTLNEELKDIYRTKIPVLKEIKGWIKSELSKCLNGAGSKSFEYVSYRNSLCSGFSNFNGSGYIE